MDMIYDVCVIGQGFVGLPLAMLLSVKGLNVIGLDINNELVENLNMGITNHVEEYDGKSIKIVLGEQLKNGRYICTTEYEHAIRKSKIIIMALGIPIINGQPNMNPLIECCEKIGRNLKREHLILIKSTLIPGTTEEVIIPLLEEQSKMKAGEDFYVAYSSERISEGKAFEEFINMPTLVSGINKTSINKAKNLINIICESEIIEASNIKSVETAKVFENVQMDVNIALSQEMSRYTESLGIDIFEVINLANTHKRVNLLTPGPGVGGYCIPNAYYYMLPKAKENDVDLKICSLSRKINEAIPDFIVNVLYNLLLGENKRIESSKICVLGIAMKDYSNDSRLSPAIDIIKKLIDMKAEVKVFDSVVDNNYEFKVNSQIEAMENADVILVLAKQKDIIYDDFKTMKSLMKDKPIYIDTKNILNREQAENNGFIYWRI